MPKMNVTQSIYIDARPEKIYPFISNLNHWPTWSPWTVAEPSAKITVTKAGDHYTWEGKIIGEGHLTVVEQEENKSVVLDLVFLKPWKSTAKTSMILTLLEKGTKVTWNMDSRLPFFLFWMKKQMQHFIGMDYTRGLTMLKDLVETGNTNTTLAFLGEVPFEATPYIGIATDGAFSEISNTMERDYTALMQYIMQLPEEQRQRPAVAIYTKMDVLRDRCAYIAAHPVREIPDDLPEQFITGELPSFTAYTLRHTGPYRHIGNAWAAGMMHQRNKKFKSHKKIHPMEVMHNSPKNTPENKLVSDILFPVQTP